MGESIIQVQNLKKYFKTPKGMLHAVDGVSFDIERGTTLGLVGESGCGKSTLGKLLIHLLQATEGKIFFNGEDITTCKAKQLHQLRPKMQMIFQDPYASLDPRKSVEECIAEPLKIYSLHKDKAAYRERLDELMATVGLAPRFAHSYPHELDGGRRQRIGVARALALNPEFIVCDEPVSALDVSIQAQILNLLMDIQDEKGLTYLFITHDLGVVKHISHKIAVMYLGQCVEYAATADIFSHPLHPYTKGLLDAVPVPKLTGKDFSQQVMMGELTSPIEPKPGCRFAPRCPYASAKCMGADIPLKEVEPGHFVACSLFE